MVGVELGHKCAKEILDCYTLPQRYCEGIIMSEIIFVVEETPEGGYTARALGESIFTEADDLAQLHARARDAVICHFDAPNMPKVIRLHFVKDEVIAV